MKLACLPLLRQLSFTGCLLAFVIVDACDHEGLARAASARLEGPIANGSSTATTNFPSLYWLHDGADAVQHLASQPAECVDLSGAPARHALVEAGRLLFRHPVLFGGWAAELALSCESCHAGGRAHAQFHLPGRSGAPGTVDLDPEDGLDPRPIPPVLELATGAALEERLARHISQDFAGATSSAEALRALSVYLGALSSTLCSEGARVPRSVDDDLYETTRAINSLQYYLQVNNKEMAVMMHRALRGQLGRLRARYISVAAVDAELATLLEGLPDAATLTTLADARGALRRWHRRWLAFTPRLLAWESHSLYDRQRLEDWLRRP